MKFQLLISLMIMLTLSGSANASTSTNDHAKLGETVELHYKRFPQCVQRYDMWGLCNREGKISPLKNVIDVIEFDNSGWIAANFNNGQVNPRLWKLIGPNGVTIPKSDNANAVNFLKENRAPVRFTTKSPNDSSSAKFSYCTESGDILESRFDQVSPFSDGVAAVRVGKSVGFIGRDGHFLSKSKKIECEFSQGISEGCLAVCVKGLWGYLDTQGNWLTKPSFDLAEPFKNGVAMVRLHDVQAPFEKTNYISYIDKRGKIFSQRFHSGSAFEDGYAAASIAIKGQGRGVRWGLIDKTGKWVIEPKYISIGPLIESTRILYGQDGVGLAYNAKVVAPANYADIGSFSEGLAPFQTVANGEFGYIDRSNKVVIPPRFELATTFSEGLATVKVRQAGSNGESRIGFINAKGEICPPPLQPISWPFIRTPMDSLTQFHDGACIAARTYQLDNETRNCVGFMNRAGNWIEKDVVTQAFSFKGGQALVRYYPNSAKRKLISKKAHSPRP